MMKFVVALLAFAATVSAVPQAVHAPTFYIGNAVTAAGPDCFPERITACQRHFSLYPAANCEGLCGLCDLCDSAKVQNPAPGCEYCTGGVAACTATCSKGKDICAKCGVVF